MIHRWLSLEDKLITALRLSLGLIFLWFGALKIFGYNPVAEIVSATFPYLAYGLGNQLLGAAEAAIGIALLANTFPLPVHALLVAHLAGTFLTFVTGPEIMFEPRFPVLSLSGEFVFKNITLAIAGLLVMVHGRRKRR